MQETLVVAIISESKQVGCSSSTIAYNHIDAKLPDFKFCNGGGHP